ncbi:MAG TPA: hypothetical protein VMF62_13430 [Acetobacteraceae bacterium]|nr:hypothetical protein [Acetobacteraceae bacterium]
MDEPDPHPPARDFRKGGRRAQPKGDVLPGPGNPSRATRERQRLFLEAFCKCGSVSAAAAACGFDRRRISDWRREDTAFSDAFDQAATMVLGKLETEAWRRGVDGVERAVVSAGKIVTTERVYSDSLLNRLLARHDPLYANPAAQIDINSGPGTEFKFRIFDHEGNPLDGGPPSDPRAPHITFKIDGPPGLGSSRDGTGGKR